MSLPLVDAFGNATDDLRGAAIADFGVSGWIAFLMGAAPDSAEDDPILEFWADATQIEAATVTNNNAIPHFIIGNLRFFPFPLARLITTHFRSRGLPEGNPKKLHPGVPGSGQGTKRKAEWLSRRAVWTKAIKKE